jgi:hypothetical protein
LKNKNLSNRLIDIEPGRRRFESVRVRFKYQTESINYQVPIQPFMRRSQVVADRAPSCDVVQVRAPSAATKGEKGRTPELIGTSTSAVISSTGIYRNAFGNTFDQKIRPSEPPAASGS